VGVSYNKSAKREANLDEWLYIWNTAPKVIQALGGHA